MKELFVIEHGESYAVVKTIEYGGHVMATIIASDLSLDEAKALIEDSVPMNSCSSGHVAAIGIGPQGEPGVPKKKRRKLLRRIKELTR